jgi:DNA-binding NarL/FixJ family response regulator
MDGLRLLLIDRDSDRCKRWINEFAKQSAVQVVRCLEDLEEARAVAEELPFDISLIHAASFQTDAVVAMLNWMRRTHPNRRAIVSGAAEDSGQALRFLEAGAWSCLSVRASFQEVTSALEAALRGESMLSPVMAGEVLQRVHWLSVSVPPLPFPMGLQELTPREREILSLISRRLSNQEIAEELVLEVGTVKNHVHSVLKKLGVDNRYDAAVYGLHATNLIDVESV